MVLGPHGGGFASIMFAPEDAVIIEVDCAGKSIAFRELARQMGQPYIGLHGNFTWESRYLQAHAAWPPSPLPHRPLPHTCRIRRRSPCAPALLALDGPLPHHAPPPAAPSQVSEPDMLGAVRDALHGGGDRQFPPQHLQDRWQRKHGALQAAP